MPEKNMKLAIQAEIEQFVASYQDRHRTRTGCGAPLVGFASATDPRFAELKSLISPTHKVPTDLLDQAESVVAFFLPLPKTVSTSNREGPLASEDWAVAYIEINQLISDVGLHVKTFLETHGFVAHYVPATHYFDQEKLISDWSHRHVARIAGLGSFGLNNMLITSQGCCGRIGSLVTTARLEPDPVNPQPACLYRYDRSCSQCVQRCVRGALQTDRFDRRRCFEVCLENYERFKPLGNAGVCGKCVVGLPCTHVNPVEVKNR